MVKLPTTLRIGRADDLDWMAENGAQTFRAVPALERLKSRVCDNSRSRSAPEQVLLERFVHRPGAG